MATAVLEPRRLEAISIDQLKMHDLKKVDATKNYKCILQLGSHRSFRKHRPGKWSRDPENDEPGLTAYHHEAGVHETEPISGSVLMGLLQASNDWLVRNKQRSEKDPRGVANRMLAVQKYWATDEVPLAADGRPVGQASLGQQQIQAIVAAVIAETAKQNTNQRSSPVAK